MKPKNKFQREIIAMSRRLSKITEPQMRWAYKNCFDHIGKRNTKGMITCLECGHSWQGEKSHLVNAILGCECPKCATRLQINTTRQRVFKQTEYLCIVTTFKGFQVLRFFYIDVYRKSGKRAYYFCKEVVQRWIAASGKFTTMARLRPTSCFQDTWIFSSDLEIRPEKPLYDIMPTLVYPRQRVLLEITRNGFKGDYHRLTPFEMFHSILTDSRAETLLKAGQFSLFKHFIRNKHKLDQYWHSAKIAIRKQYMIDDGPIWCDYIELLQSFNKDIRNPKFTCPQDFKREHDLLVERQNRIYERERAERERRWALEDDRRREEREKSAINKMKKNERIFKKMRAKFFGIEFIDGEIQVRALQSVQEFLEEGRELRHCVFVNEYFLRPESLILSATVDGKRVETVEVSLETMRINQCRGTLNEDTEYHDRIIELVNRNINQIQRRMTA